MNNDSFRVESELHAATDDLADSIGSAPLPPFKPTRRKAPVAAAALLLVLGGGAYAGLRAGESETVRTPVAEESGATEETNETNGSADSAVPTDSDEGSSPSAVFGKDTTSPADTSPAASAARLGWVVDPAYGNELRRFTSATGTRFDVASAANRQIENADGSLVLTYHGTDAYRITERETGEVVGPVGVSLLSEPHWHPTNPALLRHLPDPDTDTALLRLHETNVFTGETSIIMDPAGRLRNVEINGVPFPDAARMSTREQGTPSADGTMWAWVVDDEQGNPLGVFTYNLAENQLLARMNLRTDVGEVDYVSVSPSGQYVVVAYEQGTFVYDASLGEERQLTVGNDVGDFAISADGSDAFVVVNFAADDDAGWLLAIDLATLARTRIFDVFEGGNTSMTISGQAFDRPGWAVVSTFDCKADGAWTCDKVMAVEMALDGRIVNLAHTYNCGESFWTEPNAVPSRDLSRVYFNSDLGSCGDDGEVFQLKTPPFE